MKSTLQYYIVLIGGGLALGGAMGLVFEPPISYIIAMIGGFIWGIIWSFMQHEKGNS